MELNVLLEGDTIHVVLFVFSVLGGLFVLLSVSS